MNEALGRSKLNNCISDLRGKRNLSRILGGKVTYTCTFSHFANGIMSRDNPILQTLKHFYTHTLNINPRLCIRGALIGSANE